MTPIATSRSRARSMPMAPRSCDLRCRGARRAACCRASACRLGYTLLYLGLIVLVPISAAFHQGDRTLTWPAFVDVVTAPRVMASYRLTFGASLLAARDQRALRTAGRVGARPLSLSGQASRRRIGRSSVRVADGSRGYCAGRLVRAERLGRFPAGRPSGSKSPSRRSAFSSRSRSSACRSWCARSSRCWRRCRASSRRPRRTLGASPGADVPPRRASCRHAGAPDRLRAGVRARDRRIRIGDLHRRQHADDLRDHAAHHHHQARAVRLSSAQRRSRS